MHQFEGVSDDALLRELHVIVGSHRRVTARLVSYLGEVDARRLHVERGFSSLFSYCVQQLHFSEDEACRRIEAARLARRFQGVCPLLETGAVSLTVLGLLKQHLTDGNHRELLAGVSGSSVRQAKEWLAARFPVPDVPWTIRKQVEPHRGGMMPRERTAQSREECAPTDPALNLHAPPPTPATSTPARVEPPSGDGFLSTLPASTRAQVEPPSGDGFLSTLPASTRAQVEPPSEDGFLSTLPASTRAQVEPPSEDGFLSTLPASTRAQVEPPSEDGFLSTLPASTRARIDPLSRDRFLVKFTASRALREKLEVASDLMRHANPGGELAVTLERAVDLLIAELQKKKQGRTSQPREKPRSATNTQVTRAARRTVVARDGWRCSFVADDGRCCDARAFLEFDHRTPKGVGGDSRAENLRLLCRAHNRLAAERVYGEAYVARRIADSRGPCQVAVDGSGDDCAVPS